MKHCHTKLLSLVTAISTVILLVAHTARVNTVPVGTAELGRQLTADVHW